MGKRCRRCWRSRREELLAEEGGQAGAGKVAIGPCHGCIAIATDETTKVSISITVKVCTYKLLKLLQILGRGYKGGLKNDDT